MVQKRNLVIWEYKLDVLYRVSAIMTRNTHAHFCLTPVRRLARGQWENLDRLQ